MSKYKIPSNLSEKQVESDVSNYFGWISGGSHFRLLDVNEQLTGADKKFYDSGFVFFMQFKVSEGLKPISKIPASSRKNRSALENIREFRDSHKLHDKPTLYFKLRKKAKNAIDFQHNKLIDFANGPCSQAFYVAPLHLDEKRYYKCLFNSTRRFLLHPFYDHKYKIYRDNWVSHVGHIPFLKEHVSIIPQDRVSSHEHYYSYSQTGCEIAWHSPELHEEGPSRLSDILQREISNCISENKLRDLQEIGEMLEIGTSEFPADDQDPVTRLQLWGKNLYSRTGIKPFFFLGNRDTTDSYREQYMS